MRPLFVISLMFLVLSAPACSSRPSFHPPDRSPSIEGIITRIDPYNVSTGVIEVTSHNQAQSQGAIHRVIANNPTIILVKGDSYPRTFDELHIQSKVRVWTDTPATTQSEQMIAQYIEIQP